MIHRNAAALLVPISLAFLLVGSGARAQNLDSNVGQFHNPNSYYTENPFFNNVDDGQSGTTGGGGVNSCGTPNADYYVATNGNDNWTGTLDTPNQGKTDGPFATLDRARQLFPQRARELHFRGFRHFLDTHSLRELSVRDASHQWRKENHWMDQQDWEYLDGHAGFEQLQHL